MVRSSAKSVVVSAAGEVLAGSGFVADRSGRLWYEDNGWFLSLIDFQAPVGWQGSFLNVAANFLWTPDDDLSPSGNSLDYAPSGDCRVRIKGFVNDQTAEYHGDDGEFRKLMEVMAARGLEEGVKLRVLRDWVDAKKVLLPHQFVSESLWGNWNKAMLCVITGDPRAATYFRKFSLYKEEINADIQRFVIKQSELFGGLVDNFGAAQERIGATIEANRRRLYEEGMTGIDLSWRFEAPALGSIPLVPTDAEFNATNKTGLFKFFKRKKHY